MDENCGEAGVWASGGGGEWVVGDEKHDFSYETVGEASSTGILVDGVDDAGLDVR